MVPCRPDQHAAREMAPPVERLLAQQAPRGLIARPRSHRFGDFGYSRRIPQLRASRLLILSRIEKVSGLPNVDQPYCDTTGALCEGFRQRVIPFFKPAMPVPPGGIDGRSASART
jgi:hypothetical protein